MERYIDAELAKEALTGWETDPLDEEIERTIDNIPTADVAPKSEVAMEVLAEVERIILENTYPYFDKDGKPCIIWKPKEGYDALAELKKKYTEGGT